MRALWNYINRGRLWRVYGRSVVRYGTPRKVFNAVRTEWAYRTRKLDARTPPYVLFIEPLYYCNLDCPLCPRVQQPDARKGKDQAGRLPLDLIDGIFEELGPYLFQCHIFGNGEPMLDWPRTKYIVQTARRKRIFTLISTNCLTITPQIADELVTCGLDYLVFAIDGTSQATYEKYRVGGDYARAFEGMRLVCEAKKRHKSRLALEWQFLVSSFTYPEMDRARELAKELGVFLRFSPLAAPTDPASQQYWRAPDPQWTGEQPGQYDHDFACYWLWRAAVINSNGRMGRCPGHSNTHELGTIVPGLTHKGVLESIMALYNGESSQRSRRLFNREAPLPAGESYPQPCEGCTCFSRCHGAPIKQSADVVAAPRKVELTIFPAAKAPARTEADEHIHS